MAALSLESFSNLSGFNNCSALEIFLFASVFILLMFSEELPKSKSSACRKIPNSGDDLAGV